MKQMPRGDFFLQPFVDFNGRFIRCGHREDDNIFYFPNDGIHTGPIVDSDHYYVKVLVPLSGERFPAYLRINEQQSFFIGDGMVSLANPLPIAINPFDLIVRGKLNNWMLFPTGNERSKSFIDWFGGRIVRGNKESRKVFYFPGYKDEPIVIGRRTVYELGVPRWNEWYVLVVEADRAGEGPMTLRITKHQAEFIKKYAPRRVFVAGGGGGGGEDAVGGGFDGDGDKDAAL